MDFQPIRQFYYTMISAGFQPIKQVLLHCKFPIFSDYKAVFSTVREFPRFSAYMAVCLFVFYTM